MEESENEMPWLYTDLLETVSHLRALDSKHELLRFSGPLYDQESCLSDDLSKEFMNRFCNASDGEAYEQAALVRFCKALLDAVHQIKAQEAETAAMAAGALLNEIVKAHNEKS